MKNLENARVNVIKKVLKVVGIVVVSGLVVVAGFEIFTSIYFNPHDVRLTNVTDTSFTVSWVTNYPKRGVVYYKEKDNILPGVLSWIGTGKAFDDRDVANAEKKCVDEFNKKAEVSEDFVVDTSNYNCESVKVSRLGSYYTHHVTVTNLEPGKEYYFRVGDGFVSWKRDMNQTYTFYSLEKEVKAPSPIFGKITNEEGQYVNDSIVYVKFINGYTKKESIYYSSVTADNGSWYLDGNNIRTIDGELMLVEGGQDTIQVHAQYKNFILTDAYEWVYGDSNIAYPDIVVSDTAEKDLSMNRGVVVDALAALDAGGGGGSTNTVDAGIDTPAKIPIRATPTAPAASATPTAATTRPATTPTAATTSTPAATTPTTTTPTATTPTAPYNIPSFVTPEQIATLKAGGDAAKKVAETIGYGNAAKILGNENNGIIDIGVLEKIGLAGNSSMSEDYRQTVIVGNMNAIAGGKVNTVETGQTVICTGTSCEGKKYSEVYITPDGTIHVGTYVNDDGGGDDGGGGTGNVVSQYSTSVVIPLTFGKNEQLIIPDYLKEIIPDIEAETYAKGCLDKKEGSICKINIALTAMDPDFVLSKAITAGNKTLADNIMMMLNKDISDLFKGGSGIKLEGTKGGSATIIDQNLSYNGLKELMGKNEDIKVTDELRTIFPQLVNEKTVSASHLITLINMRATVSSDYSNLIKQESGGLKNTETEIEMIGQEIKACEEECSVGTFCYDGECEEYKVGSGKIFMSQRNKEGDYSSLKGPVICTSPEGCDCIYKDVTVGVSENNVCLSQETFDYLRTAGTFIDKEVPPDSIASYELNAINDILKGEYSAFKSWLKKETAEAEKKQEDLEAEYFEVYDTQMGKRGTRGFDQNAIDTAKAAAQDAEKRVEYLNQLAASTDKYINTLGIAMDNCRMVPGTDKDYYNCLQGNINGNENGMKKEIGTFEIKGEGLNAYMNEVSTVVKGVSDTTTTSGTSSNSLGSGYITYLPEYGFFDLEIEGLIEGQKVEGGEGNPRIFYVEMNGKSGLQFPEDPDNPQVGEDIVLRANALDITYKKSAEVMTLNVKKGVNLISFSYLPQIKTDEYTKASDVILWLRSKGVKAENLSYFSAGRWRGIGYVDGEVTGEDFSITPGRGYLLYSLDDGQVSIPGYQLTSSVPISLSIGWNLVGIHGYSKVYTARSLLNSINKVEGLTANNISWWPTSKGKYEGLQVTDGKEYGFDFAISPNNGYFIRINKFEPKDTSCGSLLWQEGGTHNGVCGDSKTM